MRRRAGAIAFLLSFALPSLLTEVGLTLPLLAEPSALAQDAVTEVARQRYEEGVKAFDAGRFEDARAAFLQAYALKRHPAVLANLGQSELKSGHAEDAGNHLQQFLHEFAAATPDQRASAEKGIADAKKKSAFIIAIVDANGADVSVDGVAIGKAPLIDPYFVKPGKHTVLATYQDKNATVQVDAKVGVAAAANLALGVAGRPLPAPVAPLPGTGAQPTNPGYAPAQPMQPQGYPAAGDPQPEPFFNPSGSASFQPDQAQSGREPFAQWYKRKPLAWVGTGVAAVGLIDGIIFTVAAGSANSAYDDHAVQITAHADSSGDLLPVCGSVDGGGDKAGYEDACDALRSDRSDYHTDVALAATGWVFFGLGVAGTAAYALIDWYPKKTPAGASHASVMVAPLVAPGQRGIGIMGSF